MESPTVDLTFGPLPAPEVAYNPLDGTFWLTWLSGNMRIDVALKDREALRALARSCIAASEAGRETHAVTNSG